MSDLESPLLPREEADLRSTPRPRPPLLVSLTGYRILTILIISAFGISKAILAYKGQSISPTTLDWVFGVIVTIILYWLGFYEAVTPVVCPWLFHMDYAGVLLSTLARSRVFSRTRTLFSSRGSMIRSPGIRVHDTHVTAHPHDDYLDHLQYIHQLPLYDTDHPASRFFSFHANWDQLLGRYDIEDTLHPLSSILNAEARLGRVQLRHAMASLIFPFKLVNSWLGSRLHPLSASVISPWSHATARGIYLPSSKVKEQRWLA